MSDLPSEEKGRSVVMGGRLGIRFDSVTFSYPDGSEPVISDFSYDFRPGSSTAVLGETGSGKSTLVRLILALLLPDKGRISIYSSGPAKDSPASSDSLSGSGSTSPSGSVSGSVSAQDRPSASGSLPAQGSPASSGSGDSEEVTISPLTRCNIVYIPQGNTLMSGTIRENILLGNPDASETDLAEALHSAVADFVYALPSGLDTICGEHGEGLSEGQAQRIAIARGLLRPGGILLLDEPTSSLDNDTEKLLLERLASQNRGKTLILVTHREKTAALCRNSLTLD
ncbi:MAG: ATP-binding cassette domain-containing protein [Bacteroidales bacterium]